MRKIFVFMLLALGINANSSAMNSHADTAKYFPHPDRIRYDGSCITIEGKDVIIYSAAFHYFRCPQELWRDRFRKIKQAGFNTVETYIPWNWHERSMPADINDTSKFDFRDLKAWLKMAQEEFGLYTIVRPGPFLCAEWSGGGYPRWLSLKGPGKGDLWLRSADPEHIKWSVHWFKAVAKAVAGEQLTRKKKGQKGIILFQLENEYDAHGTPDKALLLKALYRSAKDNGVDVPLFTCLTHECRASKDPELSQVFDCDNYYVDLTEAPSCAHRMVNLRKSQPDAPGLVTELQGGWFSLVTGRLSEENYSDARHLNAISLMSLLGGATGLNYYMFYGGTHFAGWGARGMTTSYDYNAAIRENGALSAKYDVAKGIGAFIGQYGKKLARATGGPCELRAPGKMFGGIRIAVDGTRFVFLHNLDPDHAVKGSVTLVPGKMDRPATPMYNINQYGEKVLMKDADTTSQGALTMAAFSVEVDLPALGARILVIPPGASAEKGEWWPKASVQTVRPALTIQPVRISRAKKAEDPTNKAIWKSLPAGASLPALDINDFRYSLYRTAFQLTSAETGKEKFLLFNMFTRDIVSVTVNGVPAKRLFPEKADAQTWVTRGADERIRANEFDNRFDVAGLLKEGANEIIVAYENLGHAHGYVPMEEPAGIRAGGLSVTDTLLSHPLNWEYAADVAGVTQNYWQSAFDASGWENIGLDITGEIPRKGNRVQPKGTQTGLFTWYRIEFSLPDVPAGVWVPWMARINASGNGFMWLNGHNIGRHWEAGPQREFYLPECWLNMGKQKKNILTFGLRQTSNGAQLHAVAIIPGIADAMLRH
ncbi:glycosyl hydrolase family 35 [Chitinophaga polysaccharea]|uniref:Glycosyl hydrolase family 35 n=1 Tax=Chitinophaga polysaccharea TaxID=1293035 RepID=A0A561PUF4_9BACT|nr:beta-galactosidase [Chitinophaga polysaccharea]TWF41741.1 glycosyl hydrolase family 35 [Chitinophaga polysaccharea]